MPYRNTRRKNNRTNRNKRNKRKSRKTQSGGSAPNTTGATAFSELTTYTIDNTSEAVTYFEKLLGDLSKYPKIQELIDSNNTDELTTLKNQIINLYIKEITTVNFNDHLDNVIKKEDTLAKLNKLLGGDLCSSDHGSSSGGGIEAHKYEVDPSTSLEITDGINRRNPLEIPLTTVAEASGKIKALWGDTPTPGLDKLFPSTNIKTIDDITGVFKEGSTKNQDNAAELITLLYNWEIHNENAAEGEKNITGKFEPLLVIGGNKLGIKIRPKLDRDTYKNWLRGLGDYSNVRIKVIQKPNLNDAEHVGDLRISEFEETIKDKLKTIEIPLKIIPST